MQASEVAQELFGVTELRYGVEFQSVLLGLVASTTLFNGSGIWFDRII